MSDVYLVKTLSGALRPIDGTGEEYLQSIKTGEVVCGRFSRQRVPGHHRKLFGIIRLVFQNQEKYLSEEGLRKAITIQAGFVESIRLKGDEVRLVPMSLAWDKMDQAKFQEFYDAALLAIPELLPQFFGVNLERELLESQTHVTD